MIVNHITSDQSSTYNLDNSLEKWVLDAGVTISTTSGNGLSQDANFHNDIITIDGTITQTAANFQAVKIGGSITDLIVGRTGSLSGWVGVFFYGTNHDSLVNNGGITATGPNPTAVSIGSSTNFTMENHGTIDGQVYVFSSDKVKIHLAADGELHSTHSALNIINDAGARTTIINDGLVEAGNGYDVLDGRDGVERLINHGKMVGGFQFDAGNDYFDTRDGEINGSIYMGEGDDTVLIAKSSAYIYDYVGEGTDTVKANCSFTLTAGSETEYLRLLGTSNFQAFGNEFDNHLFGNRGNNKISGFAGMDHDDRGKGADTFVFATGYGKDTITDFHPGTDRINLADFGGITGFADLKAHHLSVSGSDLVITVGSDALTLENVSKADLHAADFIF